MPFHELCHFLMADHICRFQGIETDFYVGKNCFFMSNTDNDLLSDKNIRFILIAGSFGKVLYLICLTVLMHIAKFSTGILVLNHTILVETLFNWNPVLPFKKTNDCKEFINPRLFRNTEFPERNFSLKEKHCLMMRFLNIFLIAAIISVILYITGRLFSQ